MAEDAEKRKEVGLPADSPATSVAPISRRSQAHSRRSRGVNLGRGVVLYADDLSWHLKLGKRDTYHRTLADALGVAAEHLLRKAVAEQEVKNVSELRDAVRAVGRDVVKAWINGVGNEG